MRDVTYPLELALIALLVLGHVNAGIDFLRPQAPMTCTMVADKNVVFNNQGSFVLTFQPVTTVSTNANAKLTIPLKWSTDSKRNVVNTGSTTTTCSIQLASGGSAAACTVTPILATCNLSPLTVGQSYTITCTNIMNPTSTAPTGVFALSSFQGTTTQDTCSNLQISSTNLKLIIRLHRQFHRHSKCCLHHLEEQPECYSQHIRHREYPVYDSESLLFDGHDPDSTCKC
jgi:hypothetical protein